MQYLYDDVIPPFRFFSNIVMRCLNDALERATFPQHVPHGGKPQACTSIEVDALPYVDIPTELVTRSAFGHSLPGITANGGAAFFPEQTPLTAVFVGYSAVMCGFADGRVVLTRCFDDNRINEGGEAMQSNNAFVVAEITSFAQDNGHVVALHCVPFTERLWAVAIGYAKVVYVSLVEVKRSGCFFLTQRRRTQLRVVEIKAAEWAPGGQVSSLHLSPCLTYFAIAFNNDALVTVARLPSLEVPHEEGTTDHIGRFTLPVSSCVVKDGCLTGAFQGRPFFLPEKISCGHLTVFSSAWPPSFTSATTTAAISAASEEVCKQCHPVCLLMWVGSSNYTRCSLSSMNTSAVMRANEVIGLQAKEEETLASAAKQQRPKLELQNSSKKGTLSEAKIAATTTPLVGKTPFSGIYRGLLPGRIVAATVASANGDILAAMCDGGLVYLVDGHGITSVISSTPTSPRTEPLRATGLCSAVGVSRKAVVQAVTVTLETGTRCMLSHIRGIPGAAFTKWATVSFLQEIEGLHAVLPLGELPQVLVFCTHGVYLWDVHYNCVVVALKGLPPLEPFEIHSVAPREGTVGVQQPTEAVVQINHEKNVYLPFCTESAIFWRTTDGVIIRLLMHDLFIHVYPLIGSYFPRLNLRTLSWLLEHMPPQQRHSMDCVSSFELPIEQQLQANDNAISGGGPGWRMSAFTTTHPTILQALSAHHNPDATATEFLRATCASTYVRMSELSHMFDL